MEFFEDPTMEVIKLAQEQEQNLSELKAKRAQAKKRTKDLLKQVKVDF